MSTADEVLEVRIFRPMPGKIKGVVCLPGYRLGQMDQNPVTGRKSSVVALLVGQRTVTVCLENGSRIQWSGDAFTAVYGSTEEANALRAGQSIEVEELTSGDSPIIVAGGTT